MAVVGHKTAVGFLYPQRYAFEIDPVTETLEKKCQQLEIVAVVPVTRSEAGDVLITPEDITKLQQAEIIVADPLVFRQLALDLPNLKWLHSYWAGVEPLTRDVVVLQVPSYIVTRNGSSFVQPVAQYVVMYILARERHLIKIHQHQQERIWKRPTYRFMSSLSLGILGLGVIGKETAKLAKSLGMKVWGLVRSVPEISSRCSHVDEYRLMADLPELLSECDYVCNILPATTATDGLLDGDILSHCQKKKSILVNIGRGNVIRNSTVLQALDRGWISHAILDVFEKEPLPADSELWTHPQVTITPHVAGFGLDKDEFVDNFMQNLEHYKKAEPMNHVVDWSAGY